MKNKFGFLVMVFAMLLCFTTSCTDDLVDYEVFGSISGMVIDIDTQNPIPHALVTLSPSGINTYTGNEGNFEFIDLDAHQYSITVQKNGYITNRKTVTIVPGGNRDICITMEKNN